MGDTEKADNIDVIRREVIVEIKEKIKKNPKYLHPANKERQDDMKRLGFYRGYEYNIWLRQNFLLNNPTDIDRKRNEEISKNAGCETFKEYKNKGAQKRGFKDIAEATKEWRHNTGRQLPITDEGNSTRFGYISQNYVMRTFEGPEEMPTNNPGFDWKCKNGDKIEHKGSCLQNTRGRYPYWIFNIDWNNIADYFILSAWDSPESLIPLHIWIFHKNDMVRKGNSYTVREKFWRRGSITITNTPDCLKQFEKWEFTNRLYKLKELCNKHHEIY